MRPGVSGFFLLVWVYYLGLDLYLIDPSIRQLSPLAAAAIGTASLVLGWFVYDRLVSSSLADQPAVLAGVGFAFIMAMAYFYQSMFSGRGALIHTGALMGTMMSGNVFLKIIPNQRKVIADLIAGRAPDPALGKEGKTRSTHNNYLTLPVLFLMISGHYPMVFASPYALIMVGFVLVAGALIRHFYNERHAGRGDKWWAWAVAAACMLVIMLVSMLSNPAGREVLGMKAPKSVRSSAVTVPANVEEVIVSRCSMCHAAEPV